MRNELKQTSIAPSLRAVRPASGHTLATWPVLLNTRLIAVSLGGRRGTVRPATIRLTAVRSAICLGYGWQRQNRAKPGQYNYPHFPSPVG